MPRKPEAIRVRLAWPPPADLAAAARLAEAFAALGAAEAGFAARGEGRALLAAIGGNSPYLSALALAEPALVRGFVRTGPEPALARATAGLDRLAARADGAEVAARLRIAKRQVALAVALADLSGRWPLARVTGALSDFADRAVDAALGHLLRAAHRAGEIRLPDPARPTQACGFAVLAMGKLGARELNYSSDIDLVLLYDPDSPVYHGDQVSALCNRLARDLVQAMSARAAEGYVFRIDLRLRPDPAATPLAVALPAALTYYERMGESWERAALIKARPAAGDRALGAAFLEAIRPFVWRRSLDFATIADIAAVKRRIDARSGKPAAGRGLARFAGRDLKLGRGGIREIEFLAQTLELVWGGREPALRIAATVPALRALARAGHLPPPACEALVGAYRFLRRAEHRLQMREDRQTHRLPESAEDLAGFARFLGYRDPARLEALLARHLGRVEAEFAAFFAAVPAAPGGLDLGGGGLVPEESRAALAAQGFAAPDAVAAAQAGDEVAAAVVRRWAHALGVGIANAINTFDPDEVVIGGGGAAAGELLLQTAAGFAEGYVHPGLRGRASVRLARWGATAG
ncbi:MAG: ROK family protein, partial [Acetobacteraceae bacterium]